MLREEFDYVLKFDLLDCDTDGKGVAFVVDDGEAVFAAGGTEGVFVKVAGGA